MKTVLFSAWIGLTSFALFAQDKSLSVDARQQLMQKLDWMIGQWVGTGWIDMGAKGSRPFSYVQNVQTKLDGLILVVDGEGIPAGDDSPIYWLLRIWSYPRTDSTFKWQEFTIKGTELREAM